MMQCETGLKVNDPHIFVKGVPKIQPLYKRTSCEVKFTNRPYVLTSCNVLLEGKQ